MSSSARTWMRALSDHYGRAHARFPNDDLCIVFDIDGTILDMRHLVLHVLRAYDRRHGTRYFRETVADDIVHHEDAIEQVLSCLRVPFPAATEVAAFYRMHLWRRDAVLAASRPFEGVFGVIRWFQTQPRTQVALNTGRPHHLRAATLESLNAIGHAHRVRFTSDLLCTAPENADVPVAKASAIAELRARGQRVVAVVDNEPENLRAMAEADAEGEILFLHADTIFASQRVHHDRIVTGRTYRLTELVPPRSLPNRVSFVWHGVNDAVNLQRFLGSDVRWAEVDVRMDPFGRLVLRHDGFDRAPGPREGSPLAADDAIRTLAAAGRSLKLDLKEGGLTLARAVSLVERLGVPGERLWFNAELPAIGEVGFASLGARFPDATISCPADFLLPLMRTSAAAADRVLDLLRSWGITRLSFRWHAEVGPMLDLAEATGWEVNLYDVPDLEAFLAASLLFPTSVTADFNFPEWRYFGRGSGANGQVLSEQPLRAELAPA